MKISNIFIYALVGIVGIWARPQDQEGYNYEVPENPLVIQRPTEDPVEPPPPADDYVEYDESQAGESLPDSQDGGHEGGGHHGHGDDPLDWLRASVPGEPDLDYPILAAAPETSFTCDEKADGMYADVEARCQVWHQCFAGRTWAFLCPNGTIFNQEIFTCVWWFDFDCSTAEQFYNLNDNLYAGPSGDDNAGGDTADPGSEDDYSSTLGDYAEYDIGQAAEYDDTETDDYIDEATNDYYDEAPAPATPAPVEPVLPAEPTPAEPSIAPVEDLAPEEPLDVYYEDEPLLPVEQELLPADDGPADDEPVVYDDELATYDTYDDTPVEEVIDEIIDEAPAINLRDDDEEVLADDDVEPIEEGYNYPVPENPLELPERPQDQEEDSLADANEIIPEEEEDDGAIAPLALYGAPADPFEIPDSLPTEASAPPAVEEELPLAQYLPPSDVVEESRGGRKRGPGRKFRRGRKRGGRRRKLGRRVAGIPFNLKFLRQ